MITKANVCMCEFECVCWIVFPPKSSTSIKRTWFFYPKSLCFGEPKTKKSNSGFSALLHFLLEILGGWDAFRFEFKGLPGFSRELPVLGSTQNSLCLDLLRIACAWIN
jgi:hypothetical protein